jgi:hypothetical protein
MLVAAYNNHGACHAGAARLIVDAAVIIGRSSGLLTALLVPLLDDHGALPNILDDNIERCFPTTAWGQVKLGCLPTDGVLGDNAEQFLDDVLDGVSRCLKRL